MTWVLVSIIGDVNTTKFVQNDDPRLVLKLRSCDSVSNQCTKTLGSSGLVNGYATKSHNHHALFLQFSNRLNL